MRMHSEDTRRQTLDSISAGTVCRFDPETHHGPATRYHESGGIGVEREILHMTNAQSSDDA